MPNGCGKCWAEFKGWLKAFTPLELLLSFLEAVLLVIFILLLIFVVIHFITCRSYLTSDRKPTTDDPDQPAVSTRSTRPYPKTRATCTYTPQAPTTITHRYHPVPLNGVSTSANLNQTTAVGNNGVVTVDRSESFDIDTSIEDDAVLSPDETDGEEAGDEKEGVVMALVKVRPAAVTFGCVLTVVSEYWAVTAASCIESIEEVDSLDNFVIVDNYGAQRAGRSHAVSDVRVHPLYEARNGSYDLALLRAEQDLNRRPVQLASLLDYFRMTVGERAEILGFGHFRLIDNTSKRVYSGSVHMLPAVHCTPPESRERHLVPIEPVSHGRCGLGPICMGVLYSRGTPCNFCAGSPVLRGAVLVGVMGDNEQCGAACEPALYVNVAAVRAWIETVVE